MDEARQVLRRDEVLSLIRRAIEAPSSHNTQPWRFRADGASVLLLADPTRALPVNDPDDRELAISCGCALFNLRVAAAAAGLAANVVLLSGEDDVLARIDFAHDRVPDDALARLAPAIGERRTYRKAFRDELVPVAALDALVAAAQEEGASLTVVDAHARRLALVALIAESDAVQWSDPRWRRELAMWMHPRRSGDGIVLPGLLAPVAQMVVRTFDLGNGVAASDRQLADGSPVLAVLATGGDTPRDHLAAGMALQRVLLSAVLRGLQASYLNQPVQIPWIRPRLPATVGCDGCAQVILRLGYPAETLRAAPRRPLEAVID